MSLLLVLLLALVVGIPGFGSSESSESGEGWTEYAPLETPDGRVFTLRDGEFVKYGPGIAKPGDTIECLIQGKSIKVPVPRPGVGVSKDPMYVSTNDDGEVRAECGGIHAETAPPGSW
jgi:hypothetical protein